MHQHHYDLERFTPGPWDDIDIDDVDVTLEAFAIEDAEHILNVRIATWIEDLCQHEVGQEWLFAPDHTYVSLHQDVEGHPRQQQWLALFYETKLFAGDISEVTDAAFGLKVERNLDPQGDIMFHSAMLTSAQPLDEKAEEDLYRRIVRAAEAHADGNSAIISLTSPLSNMAANSNLSGPLTRLISSVKHILSKRGPS